MQKTAIFDLGNVVLFFDHNKMYEQVSALSGVSKETLHALFVASSLGEQYERGDLDTKTLQHYLNIHSGKQIDLQELRFALSDIFTSNEPIVPILQNLKTQGIRLILLSNTCEAHFEYAHTHYPQLKLFDSYVLSYKVRARKPDKKIYLEALNHANCSPESCFYTDDVPEYIECARELKIDAEVFVDTETLKEHLKARFHA